MIRRAFAAVFATACLASPALATWPSSLAGVRLVDHLSGQTVYTAVSDGSDGAIVFWLDEADGEYDIRAQRIRADGTLAWGALGVPVCDAAASQDSPVAVADGAGGVVVAWRDARNFGTTGYDVYAQRLNGSGVAAWTANGVLLCNATSHQSRIRVVSDGASGAVAVWQDERAGNVDIYARRVNASGVPQWAANGVALCSQASAQNSLEITTDGAGGAIAIWVDTRNSATTQDDIYAQRIANNGVVSWTANGIVVSNAAQLQATPTIAADGLGGAHCAWMDNSTGSNANIYSNRITSSGNRFFAGVGAAVCTDPASQYSPRILSDGTDGAFVVWQDLRNASTAGDIYGQRVQATGGGMWTDQGVALIAAADFQSPLAMLPDGAGGFLVLCADGRYQGAFESASLQRVTAAGAPQWNSSQGLVASINTIGSYSNPVPLSSGGALLLTSEYTGFGMWLGFAHRVDHFGYLGDPAPVLTRVRDVRGDQGGQIVARWTASYLDDDPYFTVTSYRVFRSVPGALAKAWLASGAARLEGEGTVAVDMRTIAFDENAAADFAWELVGDVSASAGTSEYSFVVPTTGDSTAGSLPWTRVRVQARNSGGTRFWYSSADSAYSVDDLAPATPAPFTGAYNGGTTLLSWGANLEPDLAGYRLYRGSSVSFVPDAGNLLASVTEAGFLDAAGGPYVYKLSAVDVHGNASGFATVVPAGALDAPGAAPRTLELSLATGNPIRGDAAFRLALPRAGRARLALYDATGRQVRVIEDGERSAGEHVARWDGRDASGSAVAPGVYLARLTAGSEARVARVCVIR